MGVIVSALVAFFSVNIVSLVSRVLLSLSLGIITYTGLTEAMDVAYDLILENYMGMPATVLQLSSVAGIGDAIGIILSACFLRALRVLVAHYGVIKT